MFLSTYGMQNPTHTRYDRRFNPIFNTGQQRISFATALGWQNIVPMQASAPLALPRPEFGPFLAPIHPLPVHYNQQGQGLLSHVGYQPMGFNAVHTSSAISSSHPYSAHNQFANNTMANLQEYQHWYLEKTAPYVAFPQGYSYGGTASSAIPVQYLHSDTFSSQLTIIVNRDAYGLAGPSGLDLSPYNLGPPSNLGFPVGMPSLTELSNESAADELSTYAPLKQFEFNQGQYHAAAGSSLPFFSQTEGCGALPGWTTPPGQHEGWLQEVAKAVCPPPHSGQAQTTVVYSASSLYINGEQGPTDINFWDQIPTGVEGFRKSGHYGTRPSERGCQ